MKGFKGFDEYCRILLMNKSRNFVHKCVFSNKKRLWRLWRMDNDFEGFEEWRVKFNRNDNVVLWHKCLKMYEMLCMLYDKCMIMLWHKCMKIVCCILNSNQLLHQPSIPHPSHLPMAHPPLGVHHCQSPEPSTPPLSFWI